MTKTKTIEQILEISNRAGDLKSFDKLSDQSAAYLTKLLKVITLLK